MDLRSIFSQGLRGKLQPNPSATNLRGPSNTPAFIGSSSVKRPASAGNYDMRPDTDLRLIVERQFMRMNEAHDRHRTEVLASYHRT